MKTSALNLAVAVLLVGVFLAPEFKQRYQRELSSAALDQIRTWRRDEVITLLYAARDTDHNNAVALREHLQEWLRRGTEPEWAGQRKACGGRHPWSTR